MKRKNHLTGFTEEDLRKARETHAHLEGSHEFLEQMAFDHDMTKEALLDGLHAYLDSGEFMQLGVDISYEKVPEMWKHFFIVTGRERPRKVFGWDDEEVPFENNSTPFRCAC